MTRTITAMILLVICVSALIGWQVIAAPDFRVSVMPGECVRYNWYEIGTRHTAKLCVVYCNDEACFVQAYQYTSGQWYDYTVYDTVDESMLIPRLTRRVAGGVRVESVVKVLLSELYIPKLERP